MSDGQPYQEYSREPETEAEAEVQPEDTIDISATMRDDSDDDAPPPMISPARGPMDQTVPDVPTGSTPLTRHDD
jgi:hypothetical protein